jgi:hypothetical protein
MQSAGHALSIEATKLGAEKAHDAVKSEAGTAKQVLPALEIEDAQHKSLGIQEPKIYDGHKPTAAQSASGRDIESHPLSQALDKGRATVGFSPDWAANGIQFGEHKVLMGTTSTEGQLVKPKK